MHREHLAWPLSRLDQLKIRIIKWVEEAVVENAS
jgi:hypothetical protein